jgi:hypothetical protein
MVILKFQRPLSGPSVIFVNDAANEIQKTIPLTKEMDEKLFSNGEINKTYRECDVVGGNIISIGNVVATADAGF